MPGRNSTRSAAPRRNGASDRRSYIWLYLLLGLSIVTVLAIVVILLVPNVSMHSIGVISIDKPISTEASDGLFSRTVGADQIISELHKAEKDPTISVIFLDINSPGGSVVASKAIAYAVRNCSKPVVAYINDIGTSGAYYVASAADLVIADEDSLTGSIGVIMELQNYAGLFKKLGINTTVIKEGKFKDIGNPARQLTPEEKRILENITALAYEHFKRDLLAFRGDKLKASINEIADGRPLTGYQAWKLGLVDELGTRQFALEQAWKLAGGKGEPRVKQLGGHSSLLDLLSALGMIHAPSSFSSMKMVASV